MGRTINVVFRYQDITAQLAAEFGAVAVIDTLRATTTMVAMLDRGAVAIKPVATLEEAYGLKSRDAALLLGGERHNHPPEGFDGGNSPNDWPRERVFGRRVVFTTTNGTQAIEAARPISRLVLGALTNAEAVSRYLWSLERPVLLVASGSRGRIAMEDVLACGAIAQHWPETLRTDAAEIACRAFWQSQNHLVETLLASEHGRTLAAQGWARDVEEAAALNGTRVVPILCTDGWIRAVE
ncbi:MAG: 2-phosphosulfolactate phosphatase [Firmicutes bacterium]|nr:2-phosphosulfolactate phosphatase [Bacillota bacterium]